MDIAPSSARIGSLARRLALSALPVVVVALLAPLVTRPNIPGWYEALAKPPLTPPNWLFAPVWAVLFAAMAYAAFRIASRPVGIPGRYAALVAFHVQLVLNALWSWTFFGLRSPALASLDIAALLAAILVTLRLFWRLDRPAGALLVPYAAWVGYAAYLTLAIWRLNG